jgi:hypothetical protein
MNIIFINEVVVVWWNLIIWVFLIVVINKLFSLELIIQNLRETSDHTGSFINTITHRNINADTQVGM